MISVCVATYNGEKFIKEQLISIMIQLGDNDEIIISDDGSTDKTLQIIDDLNDERICVIKNRFCRGVNHNFENALKNANGDIIFLSDQDDIWLPNKIKICCDELKDNDLVVSNCIVINELGNIIYPSYFDVVKSGKGFFKNFYRSTYLGCCLAFKKEVLLKVLPIPSNLMVYHDWWFGFISEFCFKVKFIETPCMYYRRHKGTNSNTLLKSKFSIINKIRFRFQLFHLGIRRLIKIRLTNVV